jgi:hypothetical protein
MARFFTLALFVVGAVALADLVTHPQGTKTLTGAAVSAEKSALNAELGKTS